MIPQADIVAWRSVAPWASDAQVEQDLIISRVLVEIFSHPVLRDQVIFRGGTALHKLYLHPASRYSEDIDLVQKSAEPIGKTIGLFRSVLESWLGAPRREQGKDNVTLTYRTESEIPPVLPLRVKIEINTREHFTEHGFVEIPFSVHTRWFDGESKVVTYTIEELLGTKLRALYQRRKGRDLFDIWLGVTQGNAAPDKIAKAFRRYVEAEGLSISQTEIAMNLELKMSHKAFQSDIVPLLRPDVKYDPQEAFRVLKDVLLPLI